ncbi:MAG: hypothetical protein R3F20_11880 [Planctomycetota bacterium]
MKSLLVLALVALVPSCICCLTPPPCEAGPEGWIEVAWHGRDEGPSLEVARREVFCDRAVRTWTIRPGERRRIPLDAGDGTLGFTAGGARLEREHAVAIGAARRFEVWPNDGETLLVLGGER